MEQESGLAKQYRKMTMTPIPKLVIGLGIPTTISMLVTSVYNMADTFFIGKYGTSASGAVGIVFSLMSIIQAFGFMMGQGAGSLSSRALGAMQTEKASRYSSTGFFAAFLAGLIICVLGLIWLEPFMRLLGSTDTILPYAKTYAVYILLAAPFMCSSCVLNNVLRFEGQASFAMIGLASGGLLNIIGDYLLMDCLHWGMVGAGLSTAVSQCISFFILLSMFLRGKTSGKIAFRYVSFRLRELWEICKTGFPSLVRQGFSSVSTMLLNHQAALYGDAAVAAMSIVNRICFFTFATALGIGQGFQPVCAFNFGAKQYSRVRKSFLFTFFVGEVFLGSVAVLGLFLTHPLIRLFRDDEQVIAIGAVALAVQLVGQIFQPMTVCSNMMFQTTGQVKTATLLSMLRSGLLFLPILFLLTKQYGLWGIQSAQGFADVLAMFVALPFTIRFLRQIRRMEDEQDNE